MDSFGTTQDQKPENKNYKIIFFHIFGSFGLVFVKESVSDSISMGLYIKNVLFKKSISISPISQIASMKIILTHLGPQGIKNVKIQIMASFYIFFKELWYF